MVLENGEMSYTQEFFFLSRNWQNEKAVKPNIQICAEYVYFYDVRPRPRFLRSVAYLSIHVIVTTK